MANPPPAPFEPAHAAVLAEIQNRLDELATAFVGLQEMVTHLRRLGPQKRLQSTTGTRPKVDAGRYFNSRRMNGVCCPVCTHPHSGVTDSRPTVGAIRRRRRCKKCNTHFTTLEEIPHEAVIIKAPGD